MIDDPSYVLTDRLGWRRRREHHTAWAIVERGPSLRGHASTLENLSVTGLGGPARWRLPRDRRHRCGASRDHYLSDHTAPSSARRLNGRDRRTTGGWRRGPDGDGRTV